MVYKRKRYGIVLIDKSLQLVLVLRRINYALYNRLNNNFLNYSDFHKDMFYSMYFGLRNQIFEFPKGVKEKKETGFQCALREFSEETGIRLDIQQSDVIDKISYTYIGNNNKRYSCIYFVVNENFKTTFSTTVLSNFDLPVLGDNFNILLVTKWCKIRKYFIQCSFYKLITKLDEIFGIKEGAPP
jgi:8-oxo-dGTP pyrophosphatase MutT (NUDIX family)